MAYERILAYLLAFIFCLGALEAGAITKRRAPGYFENDLREKELGTVAKTNDMLMRLIDAVIEHAREQGASEEEMHDLVRKRSGIRKCFFHAVNCW